jgi:hypothetical protein
MSTGPVIRECPSNGTDPVIRGAVGSVFVPVPVVVGVAMVVMDVVDVIVVGDSDVTAALAVNVVVAAGVGAVVGRLAVIEVVVVGAVQMPVMGVVDVVVVGDGDVTAAIGVRMF